MQGRTRWEIVGVMANREQRMVYNPDSRMENGHFDG